MTHLVAVPSLLSAIAGVTGRIPLHRVSGSAERGTNDVCRPLASLRYVVSSGDELISHVVQLFKAHVSDQTVFLNIYGSTETTADAMYHVCFGVPDSHLFPVAERLPQARVPQDEVLDSNVETKRVLLGHPLGNTDVYFVPHINRSTRDHRSSEQFRLMVIGDCVAAGYMAPTSDQELVASLQQLELRESEGFMYVSSSVLQDLSDRCVPCVT